MASRGGQKGNQNAAKGRYLSSKLKERLEARKDADKLAEVLIDKALEGDMAAIKEVFDRLEGKPKQTIDADLNVTNHPVELSDNDLANIAAASSNRATSETES